MTPAERQAVARVKKMTPQQIFTKGAKHLLKQKRQCRAADGPCAVRSKSGKLACAVGAFLPDDENTRGKITTPGWSALAALSGKRGKVLCELLSVHDGHTGDWYSELQHVANKLGLKMPSNKPTKRAA